MKGFLNKVQNSVVGGGKDGKSSEGGMIDGTPRADVILPKKSDRR